MKKFNIFHKGEYLIYLLNKLNKLKIKLIPEFAKAPIK